MGGGVWLCLHHVKLHLEDLPRAHCHPRARARAPRHLPRRGHRDHALWDKRVLAALVHHVSAPPQEAAAQLAGPLHQLCPLFHQRVQPHEAVPVLPINGRQTRRVPPHFPVGLHHADDDHHPLRPGDFDAQVARLQLEGDAPGHPVGRADALLRPRPVLPPAAVGHDRLWPELLLLLPNPLEHPRHLHVRVQERGHLLRGQLHQDPRENHVGAVVDLPRDRDPRARGAHNVRGEPRVSSAGRCVCQDCVLRLDPQRQLLPPRHHLGAANGADARKPGGDRGVDQPHQEGERGAQDAVRGGGQHGPHGQALRRQPLARAPHPPQQRHRLQLAAARGRARAHPRGLCQEQPHVGRGAAGHHRAGARLLEARGLGDARRQRLVRALPLQPRLRRAPRRHHRPRVAPQGHVSLRHPPAPPLDDRRQVSPPPVPHQPHRQRRQVLQGPGRRGHCRDRGAVHRRRADHGPDRGDGQRHRHPRLQARPDIPALQPGLRRPEPQVRWHGARARHHQEDHRGDGGGHRLCLAGGQGHDVPDAHPVCRRVGQAPRVQDPQALPAKLPQGVPGAVHAAHPLPR
mmetsp:Transcript_33963/g.85885  ORF Transcript_33963/g.85885 Transcript_33963/m.85885 type:complete len:572 (+) Transcript_33963:200-1915(+)